MLVHIDVHVVCMFMSMPHVHVHVHLSCMSLPVVHAVCMSILLLSVSMKTDMEHGLLEHRHVAHIRVQCTLYMYVSFRFAEYFDEISP